MAHINPRLALIAKPDLKHWPNKNHCDDCTAGKIHKFGHHGARPSVADLPWAPGEYFTCDLFGPVARSSRGARYAAFYIDLKSRYVYARALNSKDDHYEVFRDVIADAKARSGRAMRFFKTDGDGIFTGDAAAEIYRKHAIRHTMSAPGDSSSNDIAERTIRTFAELLRTNLMHANAPASFWVEALGMIEYVWNHLAVIQVADGTYLSRTSILEGHQRQYDLNVLRAFGTKCHFLLTPQKKGGLKLALEAKGRLGIILGIEDNMPAYRVYDLSKRRVARIPFAQLISHEGHFPFRDRSLWSDEDKEALPFMLLPEEARTDEVQTEAIEEVTLTVEPSLAAPKVRPATRSAPASAPAASAVPTASTVPTASVAPPLSVPPPAATSRTSSHLLKEMQRIPWILTQPAPPHQQPATTCAHAETPFTSRRHNCIAAP